MSYPDDDLATWTYKELYDDVRGALINPDVLDALLDAHAHKLAEKIRAHDYDPGEVGPIHLAYQDAADFIDPEVAT